MSESQKVVCTRIKLSDFSKSIKGTQSANRTVVVSDVMISKSKEVKQQPNTVSQRNISWLQSGITNQLDKPDCNSALYYLQILCFSAERLACLQLHTQVTQGIVKHRFSEGVQSGLYK